jgi:tetratricopeptide (TPR) repeat protein
MANCKSLKELANFLASGMKDKEFNRHLKMCLLCRQKVDFLKKANPDEVFWAVYTDPLANFKRTENCLSESEICSYVDSETLEQDRMAHLISCDYCLREVYMLMDTIEIANRSYTKRSFIKELFRPIDRVIETTKWGLLIIGNRIKSMIESPAYSVKIEPVEAPLLGKPSATTIARDFIFGKWRFTTIIRKIAKDKIELELKIGAKFPEETDVQLETLLGEQLITRQSIPEGGIKFPYKLRGGVYLLKLFPLKKKGLEIKIYLEAIKKPVLKRTEKLIELAEELRAEKKIMAAIDVFERGFELDPYNEDIFSKLFSLYIENKIYDKARRVLLPAYERKNPLACYLLAKVLFASKNYKAAIKKFEEAKKFSENHQYFPQIYTALMLAYYKIEQSNKAIKIYSQIWRLRLRTNESDALAVYFLKTIGKKTESLNLLLKQLQSLNDKQNLEALVSILKEFKLYKEADIVQSKISALDETTQSKVNE